MGAWSLRSPRAAGRARPAAARRRLGAELRRALEALRLGDAWDLGTWSLGGRVL